MCSDECVPTGGLANTADQRSGGHALKVHPVTLALAIVVLDLVAITIALLVDARRPEIILLILNVLVLLVLYFVHASGGIRFGDDD